MRAILFICFWIGSTGLCLAGEVSIGLTYRNFSNIDGSLADGSCCDHRSLVAPNCPPNQCDTAFNPCATYIGGYPCEAYSQNPTMTVENLNSFVLGKFIVNVNGKASPSSVVYSGPYSPGDINFYILAEEGPYWNIIANFSFVIDWMEEFFWDPPRWRQLVLKDGTKELGIDVFHQCAYHYFGPSCDTYCKPTHQYTCDNNGFRICTYGWEGPDCDRPIPCTRPSGHCQNGGICVNTPSKGYTCICDPPYTGNYCENDSTTTALPIMGKGKTHPGQVPIKPDPTAGPEDGLNPNKTTKTHSPSISGSGQSVDTIVYVSIALGIVLLVATASVLLLKKMKKSSVGSKEISAEADKISEGGVSIRSSEPANQAWSSESFP